MLVPALAILGSYQGGRAVVADSGSKEWRAENSRAIRSAPMPSRRYRQHRGLPPDGDLGAARPRDAGTKGARALYERRAGTVNLSYGNGRKVRVPKGLSVLEASLRNNIPHASVCGGRARCSTCRIRVIGDCADCRSPPSPKRSCSTASAG